MDEERLKKFGIAEFNASDYLNSEDDCERFLQACRDQGGGEAVMKKAYEAVEKARERWSGKS